MTNEQFLQKLLEFHKSSFDIIKPFYIENGTYDAYAFFNVKNSKYVLLEKAEIWRADCFEHVFFVLAKSLQYDEINKLKDDITNWIEPNLVREGCKYPNKNHMYTYITFMIISDGIVKNEVIESLKSFRYMKNYCFGIRGYSEARMILFDLKNQTIIGNRAAKDLIKGYRKMENLWK